MLKNDENISRYIGGGKIYFTPKGEDVEREIGECQSATVSIEVETKDALNRDDCMAKKAAKAVTAINGKIEFSTQNINADNMAMSMLGKVEDISFVVGDVLPDGSTASAQTTLKRIRAGQNPIFEGKVKFVGDECGDEKPVLVVYNAILTPSGNFEYISDEYQKLSFSGEILKTNDGYFDEYRMPVGG